MKQGYIKAFELEYERDRLAKNKLLDEFISTYKRGTPEFPNLNSGEKWDELNKTDIDMFTNPMAYHRINIVHNFIALNAEKYKLLDIGFGQGALEEKLNRSFKDCELWGIDISKESVSDKRRKYPNWKFIVGDITKVNLPKKYFDYIVVLEVLEHINPSKILTVLSKIHASLKNGGHIITSVPLNEGLEEMISKGINPNAHVRTYTPNIIKSELKITGYKIEKFIELYAFHFLYRLKSIFAKCFLKKPNNIIILARKI